MTVTAGAAVPSSLDRSALQGRLDDLAAQHHVVGASFALLRDGETVEVATGIANLRSGAPATPATLFQIGSITKVYTATLIMQLAERGLLDLDAPLTRDSITARHLLTHTSGIDGDHFADTGRGDDAVARYVATCADLPQLFAPGRMFSYSNAGYVILGRAVETLLGTTWDRALRDNLLQPLGCEATFTLPEEAILHPVAIGHLPGENADLTAPRPSPVWTLPRSVGSAGLIVATAADVLRFARMHLDGGRAHDGTPVLGAETVQAMQRPHVELIDPMLADHWGLGWFGSNWDGARMIGHDGSTIGQGAYLRILPDHGVAAVLLTSGGLGRAMHEELMSKVLAAAAGVTLRRTPEVATQPATVDLSACTGTYERYGFRYQISDAGDGTLTLTPSITVDEPLLALAMLPSLRMVPQDATHFVAYPPVLPAARLTATFSDIDGGRAQWLHTGGRAARRVEATG